jgi:hypothetical protein
MGVEEEGRRLLSISLRAQHALTSWGLNSPERHRSGGRASGCREPLGRCECVAPRALIDWRRRRIDELFLLCFFCVRAVLMLMLLMLRVYG